MFAGPVEYIHPRRRGDRSRLHGILIGHVLVDVPEVVRHLSKDAATAELTARSHGHQVVPVVSSDDIVTAVDAAVRAARG
ncbi:MAG: hypothetical protein R2695_21195 [Acidimicrobiales bacterium]